MGNLISYSKSQSSRNKALQVTDTDKAILDIRIARKQLATYRLQQEKLSEKSAIAVGHLLAANKRDRAKLALKKKKLHEGQALQIERYILRLDEQVVALETTAQQVDTVDALRTANKAIKAMQKQIPLEEIENLMEESAEANAYMEQVNTMLAAQQFDASGIDEELDALEAEVMKVEVSAMPNVPTTEPVETLQAVSQGEPHVQVYVAGKGDSAEVCIKVQEATQATEFPGVPTHEAVVSSGMDSREEPEAELVPV